MHLTLTLKDTKTKITKLKDKIKVKDLQIFLDIRVFKSKLHKNHKSKILYLACNCKYSCAERCKDSLKHFPSISLS